MVTRTGHIAATAWAVMLLLSACSDGVSPDAELPFRAADYLWSTDTAERHYAVERDGEHFLHAVQSDGNGSFTDRLTDDEDRLLAENSWSASPSSGLLSGAGPHVLWHLPAPFRPGEVVQSVPGPNVHATCILPLDRTNLLVGTGEDGLFHFSTTRGEWYEIDLPVRGAVTALCRDSADGNMLLFLAAGSDGLFFKARYDSSWVRLPAPGGHISDIENSLSHVLYAVIDGQLWFSLAPYQTWVSFNIFPGTGDINDIAILPVSSREEVLLVATRSVGVATIQLQASIPAQIGYAELSGFENIRALSTSAGAPYPVVGISDPARIFLAPQTGLWIGVSIDSAVQPLCIAQAPARGTVLTGTSSGVYRYDGTPPAPSGLGGRSVHTLRAGSDGAFYAGTDDGFFRSLDDGRTWTRIDGGTVLRRYPAPWQLLPPRFAEGGSWHAIDLLRDTGGSVAVTGRVLHHLDELILPDGRGRFTDAVQVRYAAEQADGTARGDVPVWTAYFVRGTGLVALEESLAGTVVSRSFLE